jgi:hypothetical protein
MRALIGEIEHRKAGLADSEVPFLDAFAAKRVSNLLKIDELPSCLLQSANIDSLRNRGAPSPEPVLTDSSEKILFAPTYVA